MFADYKRLEKIHGPDDAFEILTRIQEEENMLNNKPKEEKKTVAFGGFAERRSK